MAYNAQVQHTHLARTTTAGYCSAIISTCNNHILETPPLELQVEHTNKIYRQHGFKNDQTLCFHYDLAYCHTFLRETYILTKHSNDEHHLYENEVLYEN